MRDDPEAWDRLQATYLRSVQVVENSLFGLTQEAKVAAIATVFIEANRRGLA